MLRRVCGVVLLLAAAAAAGEKFNKRVGLVDPFPREVKRGEKIAITGAVKGSFRGPELIIIAPRGKTYPNRDNQIGETDFTFNVGFDEGVGPYRMEIIAHTPDSTRSIARFTIWHGAARPAEEKEIPLPEAPPTSPDDHDRVVEKRFWRMLNAFRKRIGEPAVDWNEAVAARCREHAAKMVKARRRMHRFQGVGVPEMLAANGGGPSGLSGSPLPWLNIEDHHRPFPKPSPKMPNPRTLNYVMVMLTNARSLPVMFEEFFVREAAFRICAADPHCLEIGVGVVRRPPEKVKAKPTTGKKGIKIKGQFSVTSTRRSSGGHVYYCVAFVQVNDKVLLGRTRKDYSALHARAKRKEPAAIRALGIWGRDKGEPLLAKLVADKDATVASAAWDGLLLLDEKRARDLMDQTRSKADNLLRSRRYAEAAEAWTRYAHVVYDGRVRRGAERVRNDVRKNARVELKLALENEDPVARKKALRDLLRRVRGLPFMENAVRAAMKKDS